MDENSLIDEPLRPGLDYEYLREEGIKFIKQLAGSVWTDFNEHDPGVTILEQLCFALTDLSYRTDFDIHNYFYNQHQESFLWTKDTELFSCAAVSINDYRKIIVDAIPELNNIWIFPLTEKHSAKGLYKIILDTEFGMSKEKANAIIDEVRDTYLKNRNFCEDIEEIVIAKEVKILIHASIEINEKKDAESILAEIYHRLDFFLNPEIEFYSYEDSAEYNNEEVNGPLLKNGFVKDENLNTKLSNIIISDLMKIILQIEGVVQVKDIYVQLDDKIFENKIEIGQTELLKLLVDPETICFYNESRKYHKLDKSLANQKIRQLNGLKKRTSVVQKDIITSQRYEEVIELEKYFSVQNDFPLIYGIGEYGIAPDSTDKRKAQAKQLKGYLLLFDQIMANYLSQLAHIKDLYSVNTELRQTYFYQSLETVIPNIKPLLETNIHDSKNGFSHYKLNLSKLSENRNQYIDRRNRFLDYMLAIRGEEYDQYPLSHFNYYYEKNEHEEFLINNKTDLLKQLPYFSRHRGKAFNYKEQNKIDKESNIEKRISLLLGIEYKSSSLLECYLQYGLALVKDHKEIIQVDQNDFSKENFCFVDEEDLANKEYFQDHREKLLKQFYFFTDGKISEYFLREGLIIENYNIGEVNGRWEIIFRHQFREQWIKIGTCISETEANLCVHTLIEFLKEINIRTEGLYILEHILLRPDRKSNCYGIYILSPEGIPMLRSSKLYTFEEREKLIEEIYSYSLNYSNYAVKMTEDRMFAISFSIKNDEHIFTDMQKKKSVKDTHHDMEKLFEFLSDQSRITSFQNKISLYINYDNKGPDISEDFFNFRSSIFFPDWTARFYDHEFRLVTENIVQKNIPAHSSIKPYWLGFEDMLHYENIYYLWRKEISNSIIDNKIREELSSQLINFIFKMNKTMSVYDSRKSAI